MLRRIQHDYSVELAIRERQLLFEATVHGFERACAGFVRRAARKRRRLGLLSIATTEPAADATFRATEPHPPLTSSALLDGREG